MRHTCDQTAQPGQVRPALLRAFPADQEERRLGQAESGTAHQPLPGAARRRSSEPRAPWARRRAARRASASALTPARPAPPRPARPGTGRAACAATGTWAAARHGVLRRNAQEHCNTQVLACRGISAYTALVWRPGRRWRAPPLRCGRQARGGSADADRSRTIACVVAVCAAWSHSGTEQQQGRGLLAYLCAPWQGCSPRTAHRPLALRGWGRASRSSSIGAPMF